MRSIGALPRERHDRLAPGAAPACWAQAASGIPERGSPASSRTTSATRAFSAAWRSRSGGRTEPPSKPRMFIAALVVCGWPWARTNARKGYQRRCRSLRGAGHDTATFAHAGVPAALIFVRNQNGSHNPDEAMRIEDFAVGANLIAHRVSDR